MFDFWRVLLIGPVGGREHLPGDVYGSSNRVKVHADELSHHPLSPQEADLVRQQVRVPVAKPTHGTRVARTHAAHVRPSAVHDNHAAANMASDLQ